MPAAAFSQGQQLTCRRLIPPSRMQVPFWLLLLLGTRLSTTVRDLDGVDGFCGQGAIEVVNTSSIVVHGLDVGSTVRSSRVSK